MAQEDNYKRTIAKLEEDLAESIAANIVTVERLENELKTLKFAAQERQEALMENFDKYKSFVEREIDLSAKIAQQSMQDKGEYLQKIRELKGILRVPRLYE